MTDTVFLHYTQAELDRNFDQRAWAPNTLDVLARHAARSTDAIARLERRADVPYGPGKDETLDIFLAAKRPAPVQVFVHGGAWRNFTKDDYAFPAASFVPAGVHTVVVNFTNLPEVRLPEMAAQVRRSIAWVYANAAAFGGDPARIYLSAWSSGAHLAALALETDWAAQGLPDNLVKGATLVSGPYDLEPVLLSARSSYVKLSAEEAHALSPVHHANRVKCPIAVAYAENDTDEFQRQSRLWADALAAAGRLQSCTRVDGVNHFELMEQFGEPDSPLVGLALAQMGIRPPAAR